VAVLALAGAVSAAAMAPILLAHDGATAVVVSSGRHTGTIFQPWQAWWFLGEHGHLVLGGDGLPKAGYRTAPTWLGPITHPLIAFSVVPLTLLWPARRGRAAGRREDVLLLLALLLLLRCVLDPFDTAYYHLPFLLALLSWETLRRERPPVLSLAAAVAVHVAFDRLPGLIGPDAQCAAYLAWSLPALAALGWACFAPGPARHLSVVRPVPLAA
jgi:hypothetical protein